MNSRHAPLTLLDGFYRTESLLCTSWLSLHNLRRRHHVLVWYSPPPSLAQIMSNLSATHILDGDDDDAAAAARDMADL